MNLRAWWLIALLVCLTPYTFGRTKDARPELKIRGRIDELSVSPAGKLWLVTALSETYYANSVSGGWHRGPILTDSAAEKEYRQPHLVRVNFLDEETAIITGYIGSETGKGRKDGLFRTTDGGKTWKLLSYGGDDWIYTVFNDASGNIWMGGSGGAIYHSADKGLRWKKLRSPYNSSTRTADIFMRDASHGIAGALGNELYLTSDNWNSFRKIATPKDQKLYQNRGQVFTDDRFEKVGVWQNWLVVQQGTNVWYTDTGKIHWQAFATPLRDFAIDQAAGQFYGVSLNDEPLMMISPTQSQTLATVRLPGDPTDIKAVGGTLYALIGNSEVYAIGKDHTEHDGLYTTEGSIPTPELVRKGINLNWGSDGDQLYLADGSSGTWYREAKLPFTVTAFRLVDDSSAVLWDGGRNYRYSLRSHAWVLDTLIHPLAHFLERPVKWLGIRSGSRGCFHFVEDQVSFITYDKNDPFVMKTFFRDGEELRNRKLPEGITPARVAALLSRIDAHTSFLPRLSDFHIGKEDSKNYYTMIAEQEQKGKLEDDGILLDYKYLKNFPASLDTVNTNSLTELLTLRNTWWSTTSNWLRIEIVNESNDTLRVGHSYYVHSGAWSLPWVFEYRGQYFSCYDPAVSSFIRDCMPEGFRSRAQFDNKYLIYDLASYNYRKRLQ